MSRTASHIAPRRFAAVRSAFGAAALCLALTMLGACSSPPVREPPAGPRAPVPAVPPPPADIDNIGDAVPRAEPRSAKGNPPFYDVLGKRYFVLAEAKGYKERGVASWYGPTFHAKRTSNGEPYDMYAMTAAHKTLPLPCYARVTNLANGRSVVVRINDRGPFVASRLIDLSYTAASRLDIIKKGTGFVEVEVLTPASDAAPVAVAEVTAVPPPLPAQPVPPVVQLYVQAGAFGSQRNADALIRRLQGAGMSNVFVAPPDAGQSLYRVRVGPLPSVAEYDRAMERLAALGIDGRLAP